MSLWCPERFHRFCPVDAYGGQGTYKGWMSFNFLWSSGNKLDVEAALFQRIMGWPSHTQTMQMGHEV